MEASQSRRNSVTWLIHGKAFPSTVEAAIHYRVSAQTIRRWVHGLTLNGKYYPPKAGCNFIKYGIYHGQSNT